MNKEREPATNMCRNSKRSPGGAAIREDPSSKNLNKD